MSELGSAEKGSWLEMMALPAATAIVMMLAVGVLSPIIGLDGSEPEWTPEQQVRIGAALEHVLAVTPLESLEVTRVAVSQGDAPLREGEADLVLDLSPALASLAYKRQLALAREDLIRVLRTLARSDELREIERFRLLSYRSRSDQGVPPDLLTYLEVTRDDLSEGSLEGLTPERLHELSRRSERSR